MDTNRTPSLLQYPAVGEQVGYLDRLAGTRIRVALLSGCDVNYRRRKRAFQHEEAHAEDSAALQGPRIEHPEVSTGQPRMVATANELVEVIQEVTEAGVVAYDTEFIGEETYHPKICLVQLATRDFVAIVDPFTIEDLSPVWEMLADPSVEKLVHSGSVDLKYVRRAIQKDPVSVIDTQITSAFAGLPWPVGLARAIEAFTGHRLGKGHTFTNWDARPLSRSQLRYAVDDVRYLPMLWSMLRTDLEKRGTLEWAMQECAVRLSVPSSFDPDPQTRKASKGMQLKPRAQALLRALVVERDRIAEDLDRPHRVVVPDSSLLEIVRRRPTDRAMLDAVRGLPRPTVEHAHERLLDLLARVDELDVPVQRYTGTQSETTADQVSVDALWMVICTRLLALGIAPGIVISRTTLAHWFLYERSEKKRPLFLEEDWRKKALGDWLEAFLDGDCKLVVEWGEHGAVVDEQGTLHDGSGLHGSSAGSSDDSP
jgi:ribonuclease D